MKALRNFALAFLLLGAVGACSDENGALNLGELDSGVTTGAMSGAAEDTCFDSGCDGDLGDEEIRGFDGDAEALFDFLSYPFENENFDLETEESLAVIEAIPDGVEQAITFVATDNIDCDEGSMRITLVDRENFTNEGWVPGDEFFSLLVQFFNCVIEDDFLDNGGTQSVTLNGALSETETDPETPSETTPAFGSINGTVTLNAEGVTAPEAVRGGVGEGDPFWTDVVNANASWQYNGSTFTANGGICAGEAVSLGEDNDDDNDDECAADTDSVNDAFISAGYLFD